MMLFECIEIDGQERNTMNNKLPQAGKNTCLLRVVSGPESDLPDEVQIDLQEERIEKEKQEVIEDFWAGRNLAGRNSAQWAA